MPKVKDYGGRTEPELPLFPRDGSSTVRPWKRPQDDPNLMKPSEAANAVLVTSQTVRNWCREYGLGVRLGLRWYVDKRKFWLFIREHMPHMLPEDKANEASNQDSRDSSR